MQSLEEKNILYLDNHLLIVNKPAGVLTQGDATGDLDLHTLGKQYLKKKFDKPGKVFLALVHRLDRPVSGVMVFPRTSKAAGRVTAQFKSRTVDKRYVAMVSGRLEGSDTLVDYLWKDHRKVRVVSEGHPKGLRAVLSYRAIATRKNKTLVDIKLGTGRPHQIRVQLASRGHSIIGDFRYHSKEAFDDRNLALHSYYLAIDHPTKEERLSWSIPPPKSWGPLFADEVEYLVSSA